ncbi:N-acetylmuramoyl-L-alanine amidase [Flavobacterium sp. UBA4197]|uniref:N-acetylmuramoyl-L-alanine amidase n=1 Tax=Flavobacterium sp. UBA4197 TaxID=1946546 RepID=UPI002580D21C|nr:N-acetylmuramoyl-L-alanine amidase [Flavobacterium sp. UBA4197]
MRKIKFIAVHCTATPQTTTISSIQNYWRNNLGWKMPGYHFIILPNGDAVQLLPIEQVSNGVKNYNSETINVAYLGGIDAKGAPMDNRTPKQKESLLKLLKELKKKFPNAVIQGHRDFPNVAKACPSFNAKNEYKDV